jgi:hypothetical protein
VRLLAEAARAGGAWLGLGLLVSSAQPFEVLAVVAATITLVGGIAATARRHVSIRLAACAATVLLARVLTSPASAAGVAVLSGFGWWLRMRPWDAVTGLSIFGMVRPRWEWPSFACLRSSDSRRGLDWRRTGLAELQAWPPPR